MKILKNLNHLRNYTKNLNQLISNYGKSKTILEIVKEKKNFEDKFIKLARAVYFTNDERSRVKNKINSLTKSNISEVKSYKKY